MPQSSISVVTEYCKVQPQTTFLGPATPDAITSLRREVTLQAQGESVEFSETLPALVIALSFVTVYDIASEAVLRLSNGQLVLLFDHQSKKTLRPKEVNETIWGEIMKVKNKDSIVQDIAVPTPEVIIDLPTLWSRVREHDDLVVRSKLFIKSLAGVVKPAMKIRLRGEIPGLPLVAAIYLIRPYGHTIIFESDHVDKVTLFSNF